MAHTELDLRERRAIEDMLNAKVPVAQIAAHLGRHRLPHPSPSQQTLAKRARAEKSNE